MTNFTIGQPVTHPLHGPCTITFVGDDYVGIELEDGQQVLIKKISFTETPTIEESILSEPRPSTWPDSIFVQESADIKHYHGYHFEIFFDTPKSYVEKFPEIIRKGELWIGGVNQETQRPLPDEWTRGALLAWPNHRQGLMAVISTGEENVFASCFPYITTGSQHTLIIRQINIWENGVEAQIEAEIGDSIITFFDIAYVKHRLWYEAGKRYEFILAGIAYGARPAEVTEMEINLNPDQIAWQRQLAANRGEPMPETPSILDLRGMSLFMPIREWDTDDYEFRGSVKSVRDVDIDMLENRGWFVKVTVMRFGDDDIDLDMLITKRVWQGGDPPLVGQDIEGNLWLQGYLWDL